MANKFVSFLKTAGKYLAQGTTVAATVIPMLRPFLGFLPDKWEATADKVSSIVQNDAILLFTAVMDAEQAGNILGSTISGSQKAKLASIKIGQVLSSALAISGKKPADPIAAQRALETVAGGLADYLNAYDDDGIPGN